MPMALLPDPADKDRAKRIKESLAAILREFNMKGCVQENLDSVIINVKINFPTHSFVNFEIGAEGFITNKATDD